MILLSLVMSLALAVPPDEDAEAGSSPVITSEPVAVLTPEVTAAPTRKDTALQNCVQDQDRAAFCPNGTVWSSGPCDGGEFLACETSSGPPNFLSTALLGVTALGFALPSLILAASAALLIGSLGTLIRSLDTKLSDRDINRWRTASVVMAVLGVLAIGASASVLAVGVIGAMWLERQGLEVEETEAGAGRGKGGRRYTLFATSGTGRSSPLASFRSAPEADCHNEIQRLASEDHFFKVAEIWSKRNRPLLAPLDPWRSLPRLPDRTPASQRMDVKKCEAQLAGGVDRVRRANEEVARVRAELVRVQEQARADLLECARKGSICTCNCSSQGGTGVGGLGGSVELGPAGTPGELKARLASAFAPDVKVAEDSSGGLQVKLRESIFFETDKDTLTPAAWSILSKAANVLVANPSINILVEGHASAPGSAEYNQDLSGRRAQSVLNALINLGVAKNRVAIRAHGKSRPAVRTDKEEEKNRRVIIRLVHEDDMAPSEASDSKASDSKAPDSKAPGTAQPSPQPKY